MTSVSLPENRLDRPRRLRRRLPPGRFVPFLVWPAYCVAIAAALIWGDAQDLRGPMRGILALTTIVLISTLESWLPLDPTQRLEASRDTLRDLGHLLANGFAGVAAAALPVGFAWLVVSGLPEGALPRVWPVATPWLVQCLLTLLAADFLGYWVHRLEHRLPAFWAYHVLHHDIERLHVLRGTREHFVTNSIRALLIFCPLILLGAPIEALFVFQTLTVTQGSIAHGNLRLRFPDWIHPWLLTPPVHRLHHAKDPALSNSNFSTVSPVWDRLFGTYSDPRGRAAPAIGIEGPGVPDSFLGQLAHPFRLWIGMLGGIVAGDRPTPGSTPTRR